MSIQQDTVEKTAVFRFPACTSKDEFRLEIPITFPCTSSVKELTHRLITMFKLPCYIETDLMATLEKFVKDETIKYYDNIAEKHIDDGLNDKVDIDEIAKAWEQAFKGEIVEYAEPQGATDEEVFSEVYHKLVHSPALETILQVEHSYALAVEDLVTQRDDQISAMIEKQTNEMSTAVEGVNVYNTEDDINELAGKHFEDQNLLQGKWNSELDNLKQTQRQEYRDWVMKVYEDYQTIETLPTPSSSPQTSRPLTSGKLLQKEETLPSPILEESFTIHLGSQMKQMHNIRILSTDVLDFCRVKLQKAGSLEPQPQRLQTALGLYSNDLCGLVLLTDSHVGSCTGLMKDFISVCQTSTEFHFPSVEDQFEKIRDQIKEAVSWRRENCNQENGQDILANITNIDQHMRRNTSKSLLPGDVYITRHSNLADVHVVFHMVVDDSLRSSDINSRHPVILGLRNILKAACSYDVTTLTVPVLLVHEMSEEMTVAWCTKRAELVFKCVKGFMIEMASWGGSELKNLQFLVPKGISEEVFGTLATMLPSIFRVSNPLVLKDSSVGQSAKSA